MKCVCVGFKVHVVCVHRRICTKVHATLRLKTCHFWISNYWRACVYERADFLKDEYLNNFLNDLPTSWTRSVELVQPPRARKAGQQVSCSSVYDIPISWAHATELAGLQQGLGPDLLNFHAQTFLTIPFRDRLIFAEARRPRCLALSC